MKPDDFWIKVRPRTDRAAAAPTQSPATAASAATAGAGPTPRPAAATGHGTPLLVLFGSNLGTAEGIANRLGREGIERGYQVTVAALDDHGDDLPTQGAVLIVCSSYNGEPPENATDVRRPAGGPGAAADALCAACRTRCSAAATPTGPQRIRRCRSCWTPSWSGTARRRIHPRGEGNAHADFDGQYRAWHADLWTDVASALELPPSRRGAGGRQARGCRSRSSTGN